MPTEKPKRNVARNRKEMNRTDQILTEPVQILTMNQMRPQLKIQHLYVLIFDIGYFMLVCQIYDRHDLLFKHLIKLETAAVFIAALSCDENIVSGTRAR